METKTIKPLSKRKKFAGIGNRKIDNHVRYAIMRLCRLIQQKDYVLVSGGATGCDTEFESHFSEESKIIYRAKDATSKAIDMAEEFHPAWYQCSNYSRALLGRNAMILMGKDLKTPVEFVLCYCADEDKGGTAFSIRMAKYYNIPVFNLANENGLDVIKFID